MISYIHIKLTALHCHLPLLSYMAVSGRETCQEHVSLSTNIVLHYQLRIFAPLKAMQWYCLSEMILVSGLKNDESVSILVTVIKRAQTIVI